MGGGGGVGGAAAGGDREGGRGAWRGAAGCAVVAGVCFGTMPALLVKAYAPRKGGGLGAWLCALEPGQNASMKVKGAKKIVNGAPLARNRFRRIGMLAGWRCGNQ